MSIIQTHQNLHNQHSSVTKATKMFLQKAVKHVGKTISVMVLLLDIHENPAKDPQLLLQLL